MLGTTVRSNKEEEKLDHYMKVIEKVIRSQNYILGPEVEMFEKKMTQLLNTPHVVGTNSCTDAILYGLQALSCKPGDEVIVPSFTFVGSVSPLLWLGARPVFADIDLTTFSLNPTSVTSLISNKTRGIIIAHLYGHPGNIESIMNIARAHKLWVLEDTAQAFGSYVHNQSVGTFGDIGCFSFFPGKNVAAFGDAGALATKRHDIAEKILMYRKDGAKKMFLDHPVLGGTSRLHELQAAILNVKLPFTEEWNKRRRMLANIYQTHLNNVGDIITPQEQHGSYHVYNQYVIRTKKRNGLRTWLLQHNIPVKICYPVPVPYLGVFSSLSHKHGDFPQAEKATQEVLSLPIQPELQEHDIVQICDLIKKNFDGSYT